MDKLEGRRSPERQGSALVAAPADASTPFPLDYAQGVNSFVTLFACLIADRLVERLPLSALPRWADAENNPLGSARAFKDAARREDFPTFKRGRRVTALWEDVVAYVESRKCQRKASGRPCPANARPPAPMDVTDRRRAQLVAAGALATNADPRRPRARGR